MSEYDDAYAEGPAPVSTAQLAERYVLGAIMANPAVLREVQEEISPADFEDLRLAAIYRGICGMASAGEGIDYLAVYDHLAGWDVRGSGYDITDLARWVQDVPSTANVGFYARKVRERALTRSLDQVGRTLVDAAEPGVALSNALTALTEIRDRDTVTAAPARTLRDILSVPEEEDTYDWVIPDVVERRDRLMLTAGEGVGKALALDTLLPTPGGWTTMGDVQVGDEVIGADGKPTRVIAATEVMEGRPCYRVEFSDGSSIVADAEHLWRTDDYRSRSATGRRRNRDVLPRGTDQSWKSATAEVRTTRQIAETLHARSGFCLNHSIEAASPIDTVHRDLPIDPYTFGVWLGDGATAGGLLTLNFLDAPHIEAMIPHAHHRVPSHSRAGAVGVRIEGGNRMLRDLGVLGAKRIPSAYLRASTVQRWQILRGLMDSDGYIPDAGGSGRGSGAATCELTLSNSRLAADAMELILSLGIVVTSHESDAVLEGRVVGRRWRMTFQSPQNPFSLPRKADRWFPPRTQRSRRRFITAVVPIESVPVRCIQVANPDHMYLAGRSMIPTHNSVMLRQLAVLPAAGIHPFTFGRVDPIRALVIDVENSERQWRRAIRRMAEQAAMYGARDPRDHVAVEFLPKSDITQAQILGGIHRRIDEVQPDLVVIGPMYRLAPAMKDEEDVAPVLEALDSIRERGVAMLIEAHAGHETSRQGVRNLRPRGSSALLGWPEFGLGLQKDKESSSYGGFSKYSLVRWRGDRDARPFPTKFTRGQTWPWEPLIGY